MPRPHKDTGRGLTVVMPSPAPCRRSWGPLSRSPEMGPDTLGGSEISNMRKLDRYLKSLIVTQGEALVIASSFGQSRVLFEHRLAFLQPAIDKDVGRFRVQDSVNTATITDRGAGASVRCLASDSRRAHGRAPSLALLDEPAQWEPSKAEAMLSAIDTGLGKIPGSRMVCLGTRPSVLRSEPTSGGAW